jgi:hypothetical protein
MSHRSLAWFDKSSVRKPDDSGIHRPHSHARCPQRNLHATAIRTLKPGGGSLIPDGPLNPGVMHTVATGGSETHLGLYRLETQVTAGNGTLTKSGLGSNSAAKEAIKERLQPDVRKRSHQEAIRQYWRKVRCGKAGLHAPAHSSPLPAKELGHRLASQLPF